MRGASQRVVIIALLLASACVDAGTAAPSTPAIDPADRAVRISTTGCGWASGRTGSGVAVGGGVVVTVAHLVVQSDRIEAQVGAGDAQPATVTAVDLERDLAVLAVPTASLPSVQMGSTRAGRSGSIVEAAVSGTVPYAVVRVVSLSIERVLGTERHDRLGYEVDALTTTGDSGAGAYDGDGRLVGIVFAAGRDDASSWLTASDEIDDFLAAVPNDAGPLSCDPRLSRLALP